MTILDQIRQKSFQARKARSTVEAAVLTTLLSEVAMIGKNAGRDTADIEAIAVVKKFIKGIDETISAIDAKGDSAADGRKANALIEKEVLSQFLPKQMSDNDITAAMAKVIVDVEAADIKQLGQVLKEFRTLYEGRYSGERASAIARLLLTK